MTLRKAYLSVLASSFVGLNVSANVHVTLDQMPYLQT